MIISTCYTCDGVNTGCTVKVNSITIDTLSSFIINCLIQLTLHTRTTILKSILSNTSITMISIPTTITILYIICTNQTTIRIRILIISTSNTRPINQGITLLTLKASGSRNITYCTINIDGMTHYTIKQICGY